MNYRIPLLLLLLFCGLQQAQAQDPNDCINALTVCGNANLSFNSSGPGANDFAIPGNQGLTCLGNENQSLWIRIPIEESGTLGFLIAANNPSDDYDFGVYGPDLTCTTLGGPIRCSFAPLVNNGVTGAIAGSAETFDVTTDGYVSLMNVVAGEVYYMLIDNFSNSNNGFSLTWSGTAVIAGEPSINTPVVPSFCDEDNDNLEPFDLSTLDKEITGGNLDMTVTYHNTQDEATLGQNPLPTNHMARNGETIYARGTVNENGCAATTNFTFQLDPEPANVSINGPASVCPDVSGVIYTAQGDDNYNYEWFISGGTISGGKTGDRINVSWGSTNANAYLKVLPTAINGCQSDTVTLDVIINRRLEPPLPNGPSQICLLGTTEGTYSVPETPGSQYMWTATNGAIISGNGTNEVTVAWNGEANGSLFFVESNPAITDCEGTSPTLDVVILPGITTNLEFTNVTCFDTPTGTISLNPGGGEGTLNVTWNDGVTGPNRTGLVIGNYGFVIRDDNDCEINGTVNITQPDELQIGSSTQGNLLCFQDNTGFVEVSPIGGTTPFQYQWTFGGTDLNRNQPRIGNLAMGTYNVLVTDANGCTTTGSYTLTEPSMLEHDLDQLINLPICPQSSDGEVTVGAKGGTPDYEFVWELNPEQRGQTATGLPRGNYRVNITDANGCTTFQEVEVVERFPRVYIPNAFTPNGDTDNETFKALSQCSLASYNMSIFNKWGNLIFTTTDIDEGWNGMLDGSEVPVGNYAYRVSYAFNVNGQVFSETINGRIKIIR